MQCEQCAKFHLCTQFKFREEGTFIQISPSSDDPYCALTAAEMYERMKTSVMSFAKQQRVKQLIEVSASG